MAARDGEIPARRAAILLGVHVRTVRRWITGAVNGQPTRLRHGRVDTANRYFANKHEIVTILGFERRN
jgi:hypothetical protein